MCQPNPFLPVNQYLFANSGRTHSTFITIWFISNDVSMFDWILFQTVVQRGIAMENATDALIQLIKDHGRWVDPPVEE